MVKMQKRCYFCGEDMGLKVGHSHTGVFHSVCDECTDRLKLDKRLPELLWAIADMRKQKSSCRDLGQELAAAAAAQ